MTNLARAFLSAAVVLTGTSAFAQTGPQLLLQPFGKDKAYDLKTDVTIYGSSDGEFNGADRGEVQLSRFQASGRAKFDLGEITAGIQQAQPRVGFALTHYQVDRDEFQTPLPSSFTDGSIGFGMGIAAEKDWRAGIILGVGYAGAGALGDGNAYYGKADLAIGYDLDATSTLGIVLSYDGNRSIFPDVPLPGFIYSSRFSEELTYGIGFPFSNLTWKPNDRLTFNLTSLLFTSFDANIEYNLGTDYKLSLYGAFETSNTAFKWDVLPNSQDRVLFRKYSAEIGVRGYPHEAVSLTLAGGYTFGQTFEFGWDSRDSVEFLELDAAPYIRFALEAKF
jgi:hypothetical protein